MQDRSRHEGHRSAADTGGQRLDLSVLVAVCVAAFAMAITGIASASEVELTQSTVITDQVIAEPDFVDAAPSPGPAVIDPHFDPHFDALPNELSSAGRVSEPELLARIDSTSPILMLERPKLGPLTMEQPVRVYESDVTVKISAPGGRSSFATLEVVF